MFGGWRIEVGGFRVSEEVEVVFIRLGGGISCLGELGLEPVLLDLCVFCVQKFGTSNPQY
jgi:hypothetical protein